MKPHLPQQFWWKWDLPQFQTADEPLCTTGPHLCEVQYQDNISTICGQKCIARQLFSFFADCCYQNTILNLSIYHQWYCIVERVDYWLFGAGGGESLAFKVTAMAIQLVAGSFHVVVMIAIELLNCMITLSIICVSS